MKKRVIWIISLIVVLLIGGCIVWSNIKENAGTTQTENGEQSDTDVQDEKNPVTIDKTGEVVTLNVPAYLFGKSGSTQQDLDAEAVQNGITSITLNADDSLTYVMSNEKYKEMMETTKQSVEENFKKIIDDTQNNIIDIVAEENYTEIKAYLSKDEVATNDTSSSYNFTFIVLGGLYNALNGTPAENIHIQYINQSTGAVIEEVNTAEMGQ